MTEERITRTENPDGTTSTTHTTVISERGESGGAGRWMFVILLLAALAIGAYFLSTMTGAEVAKDNAVAEAASEVGAAADQIGEAAGNAGEAVQDAAERVNPAE